MSDINNIKEAISTAIQMEEEGYAFYTKCAIQTKSMMGAQIFKGIAGDEQVHLATFKKMFEQRLGKQEFEEVTRRGGKYKDLPVFPKDLKAVPGADPDGDEIEALNIAMDSEKKAIGFYTRMRDDSADPEVKRIMDLIIEQEQHHYLLLSEELDHLNTTGDWYELGPLGV